MGFKPDKTTCAPLWLGAFYLLKWFRNIWIISRFYLFRLQAEQERLERIGPIAFYSEWVKSWERDTTKDAIKEHFEETGEDENTQMIEMFQNQTEREFRIMMGTDIRIRRDPLAMRMREDQIKQSIHSKADKFVRYFNFIN